MPHPQGGALCFFLERAQDTQRARSEPCTRLSKHTHHRFPVMGFQGGKERIPVILPSYLLSVMTLCPSTEFSQGENSSKQGRGSHSPGTGSDVDKRHRAQNQKSGYLILSLGLPPSPLPSLKAARWNRLKTTHRSRYLRFAL